MKTTRRDFIKKAGIGSAMLTIGSSIKGFSAKSYSQIQGANDRIRVAVVGVNSRGGQHITSIGNCKNVSINYVCDVDTRAAEIAATRAEKVMNERPSIQLDFRRLIEQKDFDMLTVATPEHWHAPMAIMAVKAGKHVYLEKPCSHNLHEGEMLTELTNKYPKIIIQMGTQGRSSPRILEGIKDLHEGIIGEIYLIKAWYANSRKTIGIGKKAPVPEWLNWDLWQGPAPHEDYKDNVIHYNWHWFAKWGTGEMGNNAVHQLDCCRWALGVDYPNQVTSHGGRFHFIDDWAFCDTQISNFMFSGGKQIIHECRSCNPFKLYEASNGMIVSGTKGTARILPESNNYTAYDLSGQIIRQEESKVGEGKITERLDLTALHITNMLEAIRGNAKANAPIKQGVIGTAYCHLANISQKLGRTLKVDPVTGKIIGDKEALKMSSRQYESGWEPKI